MEFYEELFLTAVISVLLAFLIGKITAAGGDEDSGGIHSASTANVVSPAAHVAVMEQKSLHPPELGRSAGGRHEKPTAWEKLVMELPAGEVKVLQVGSELDQAARDLGFDLMVEEYREKKTDPFISKPQEEMDKEFGNEIKIERIEPDFAEEEEMPVEAAAEPDEGVNEVVDKTAGEQHVEERAGEKEGTFLHGEDEWEGIERSELEKLFGVAAAYIASEKGAEAVSKLGSELQMQLFGLQKVAMEGPCYEPQPMALMISARAKWNAWQKLGSLTPDAAMELLISRLTDSIPGWTGEMPGAEVKSNDGHDPPREGLSVTQTHQSIADDRTDEHVPYQPPITCKGGILNFLFVS